MIRGRLAILAAAITLLGATQLMAETISCSSDDGRRHYCNVAPDYTRVRMVHQRSDSPCDEGRTWGTDDRGIWVDRGCRADFDVDRSNYRDRDGDRDGDGRAAQIVSCSSEDGKRHYCNVGFSDARVRLGRQRSGSPCDEGRTWGREERGIWVDRGCRADFIVEQRRRRDEYPPVNDPNRGTINNPGYGVSGDSGREKVISCSDESGHGTHCNAIVNGGVDMVRQRSESPCRQGYSWGVDNSGIWVDHGCRADFVLHGVAADR